MKKFSILLIFVLMVSAFLNVSCAGIPVLKRGSSGPSGISIWKYHNYPYKNSEETEKYEQDLQNRIKEYLSQYPITDDSIRFNFQELKVVVEGMNKDMVKILYGNPDNIETNQESLKYNSNEKWIYRIQNIPTHFCILAIIKL